MDYKTALGTYPPAIISTTEAPENGWLFNHPHVIVFRDGAQVTSFDVSGDIPNFVDVVDTAAAATSVEELVPAGFGVDTLSEGTTVTSGNVTIECFSIRDPTYFDLVAIIDGQDVNYSKRYRYHSGDKLQGRKLHHVINLRCGFTEMVAGASGYHSNKLSAWKDNHPVMCLMDHDRQMAYVIGISLEFPNGDNITSYVLQGRRLEDECHWRMMPIPLVTQKSAPASMPEVFSYPAMPIAPASRPWPAGPAPSPPLAPMQQQTAAVPCGAKAYQVVCGNTQPLSDIALPILYQTSYLSAQPNDSVFLPIGSHEGPNIMLNRRADEVSPCDIGAGSVFILGTMAGQARKCLCRRHAGVFVAPGDSIEETNIAAFWTMALPGSRLVYKVQDRYYNGFPGKFGEVLSNPFECDPSKAGTKMEDVAMFGTRTEYDAMVRTRISEIKADRKRILETMTGREKFRALKALKGAVPPYVNGRDTFKAVQKFGSRLAEKAQNIRANLNRIEEWTADEYCEYLGSVPSYIMYSPDEGTKFELLDEITAQCLAEAGGGTVLINLQYFVVPIFEYDSLYRSWQDTSTTDEGWGLFRPLFNRELTKLRNPPSIERILIDCIGRLSSARPEAPTDNSAVIMRGLLGALLSWCASGTGKPNSMVYRLFGGDPVPPETELDWELSYVLWNAMPTARIDSTQFTANLKKSIEGVVIKLMSGPVNSLLLARSGSRKRLVALQTEYYSRCTLRVKEPYRTERHFDCRKCGKNTNNYTRRQIKRGPKRPKICRHCIQQKTKFTGNRCEWTEGKFAAPAGGGGDVVALEQVHRDALEGRVDFGPWWRKITLLIDYASVARGVMARLDGTGSSHT